MKTFVLLKKTVIVCLASVVMTSAATAQTFTTIANGPWNSASTWQGGIMPPVSGLIIATMVVNIKHTVTYSGSNIVNTGTINISNPSGVSPRLIIPSGINFSNNLGGKLLINGAELRQYRFVGGGESGTSQTGTFTNNGGYVSAVNSFVEIAQSWTNKSGGIDYFNNTSLELGTGFTVSGGTTIDTLGYTSVSVGMQGSGDFTISNGKIYFKALRVEVASSNGQFTLNGGTINGSIDYIQLKNHLTNVYSGNKINFASGITTSGINLNSYCINNPSHFVPNGKVTGSRTQNCSATNFPAPLMFGTSTSRLNFSVDPALIAGTDKLVGAKYKYEGAAPGLDVTVNIDSIVGGAVINTIDDNTGANGGYPEAFQPIITSGSAIGTSYAVFSFNYTVTGTTTPLKLDTASITAVDIDGDPGIHEFDQIALGAGATASSLVANPKISLTQVAPGTFKGIDVSGIAQGGVDTTSKANMFTITNKKVSSFTAKLGMVTATSQQTQRLFSLYARSFNYPNPIPLPVKLLNFTASYTKPNVLLQWSTAQEHNFSYFLIERSTDGTNFNQAAMVFGAGESDKKLDYSYTDKDLKGRGGIIYYRLKQVDVDGKFEYSPVRSVNLGEEVTAIAIATYPNPVVNDVKINLPKTWQGRQVSIQVFGSNGQVVNAIQIANSNETESVSMSSLVKGMYFVKVSCGNENGIQKVIKN